MVPIWDPAAPLAGTGCAVVPGVWLATESVGAARSRSVWCGSMRAWMRVLSGDFAVSSSRELTCVPRMIAVRLRRAPMAVLLCLLVCLAAIVERDRGVASAFYRPPYMSDPPDPRPSGSVGRGLIADHHVTATRCTCAAKRVTSGARRRPLLTRVAANRATEASSPFHFILYGVLTYTHCVTPRVTPHGSPRVTPSRSPRWGDRSRGSRRRTQHPGACGGACRLWA